MERLLEFLAALRERPLGTVVVVGAGDGLAFDFGRFAALAPRRLVLVEGDPEHAAELERRVGRLPWIEVRAEAIAPQTGPLTWRRYSVGAFDGPLDAAPLKAYYPRLREIEQRETQGVALAALLENLAVADHLNVLAFDVPGQEDALVAAVSQERLNGFDVVGLRGCREPLPPANAAAGAAIKRLQKFSFRAKLEDDRSEPLFPLTVMRFDAGRHRLQTLERELAAARQQHQGALARIAELEAGHAELLGEARKAERRVAEHLQQVQQLTRASENDNALLVDREARLAETADRCKQLEDALARQTARADAMHEAHATASGELAAARAALDEARADADARAALEQRCADAEAGEDSARKRVAELEDQLRRIESAQSHQGVRQQMLQDELHRAEGQIELIRGLLLGDAGV